MKKYKVQFSKKDTPAWYGDVDEKQLRFFITAFAFCVLKTLTRSTAYMIWEDDGYLNLRANSEV